MTNEISKNAQLMLFFILLVCLYLDRKYINFKVKIYNFVFLTCFASFTREYAPSPNQALPNLAYLKVTLMTQQLIPMLL